MLLTLLLALLLTLRLTLRLYLRLHGRLLSLLLHLGLLPLLLLLLLLLSLLHRMLRPPLLLLGILRFLRQVLRFILWIWHLLLRPGPSRLLLLPLGPALLVLRFFKRLAPV